MTKDTIKNIIIGGLIVFGVTCIVINIDIHTDNTLLKAERQVFVKTLENYNVAYSEQIGYLTEARNQNWKLMESNRFLNSKLIQSKIEPPRNLRVIFQEGSTNLWVTNLPNGKTIQWKLK